MTRSGWQRFGQVAGIVLATAVLALTHAHDFVAVALLVIGFQMVGVMLGSMVNVKHDNEGTEER